MPDLPYLKDCAGKFLRDCNGNLVKLSSPAVCMENPPATYRLTCHITEWIGEDCPAPPLIDEDVVLDMPLHSPEFPVTCIWYAETLATLFTVMLDGDCWRFGCNMWPANCAPVNIYRGGATPEGAWPDWIQACEILPEWEGDPTMSCRLEITNIVILLPP